MAAHLLKSLKPAAVTYCGRPYNPDAKGKLCETCLHAAVVNSKPALPAAGQIKPTDSRRSAA